MKGTSNRRTKFQEQFEDSQANFSEVNEANAEGRENLGEPVQLIRIREDGKIEVNEEALNIIAQYNLPVGFVSLVGKMRTGKSCLLNRLLQLTGKGFQVDPSVSSCTQGIWMWSEPAFNAAQNNYVFFLDTQGTDSLEKDAENDTKIFTLSLLISSYFIYNSVGSIDERSLSDLEMVTALSKTIKTDSKLSERDNQESLHRFMPKFLWILRDFTLKIEDQRGRKISPTQYLENCLSEPSYDRGNEDSKKIKKSILNFFKDRECVTLVRPIGDEIQLQRLNNIPDHALRRQFIQSINHIRDLILRNAGPKTYQGEIIAGPSIASMIESYVDAFNSNKVPNIKTAWEQIAQDQGLAAYNRAIERYQQIFREEFPDDTPKGGEIYRITARLKDETLKAFEANSYGNISEKYLKNLKELIQNKEENIIEINNNVNEARNHEILKKHSQRFKINLESGKYAGKKEEMKNDFNAIIKNYNAEAQGEKKGDILSEFITDLTPVMLSMQAPNNEEIEEQKRLAKKQKEDYDRQMKLKDQALASMRKQLELKKETDARVGGGVDPKKDKRKAEKESGGCCSGDKCEIM